jgi:hypothetical protein
MTPLKAFIVCVEYADFLSRTLPVNKHHFSEIHVITTRKDRQTPYVCEKNEVHCHYTDAFYLNGAYFNKYLALEETFDRVGRDGWICIMDADICWPQFIDWSFAIPDRTGYTFDASKPLAMQMRPGFLYTPLRRMMVDVPDHLPQEPYWKQFPLHRQQVEWAGYTQIFHGSDWHLGPAPWHQTNWKHAGGGDSFFQQKWSPAEKLRPPFEVLHLGQDGRNWCGRVTMTLDGEVNPNAAIRGKALRDMMKTRQETKSYESEKF